MTVGNFPAGEPYVPTSVVVTQGAREMASVILLRRGKPRAPASEQTEHHSPYAFLAEFPEEHAFDDELKLLLMDM